MRQGLVSLIFTAALGLSAFLLFCIEPMIARMVLPLAGGSPSVWITCMLFFQAMLLAGYAYVHASSAWFGVRAQSLLQVLLVLAPLAALPFAISPDAATSLNPDADPSAWMLRLLLLTVGLPFLVVSTSAPMLQRWFSHSGHRAAHDPFFLYGASNAGSLLALLAYPLWIEPGLRLDQQCRAWAAGYLAFVVLTLACAVSLWLVRPTGEVPGATATSAGEGGRVTIGRFLHWTLLAAIPSSWMMGVTLYLTTDIAAIPLLWVLPLAIYLLSFILTFARRPPLRHRWMVRAYPMGVVILVLAYSFTSMTAPLFIPIHLGAFFLAAMVCHGELVERRPDRRELTAFYLALSLGGFLGGLFNALVAPSLFDRILEYPLAMVLAAAILPRLTNGSTSRLGRAGDVALPALLGMGVWGLIRMIHPQPDSTRDDLLVKGIVALAAVICYAFKERPIRFACGLGALLLAAGTDSSIYGDVLYQHRNYFGVLRVTHVPAENVHRLIHGHTIHGQQSLDPGRRLEPQNYFHRTSPIGEIFTSLRPRLQGAHVAVIGLGAGSLACYGETGQSWTFYEIDPDVVKVAEDPRYFTFLRDSPAAPIRVVLGDARLRLTDAPDHGYQLIVLDAFSSDAIPTHLVTREALRLYRAKLAEGGLLAFHISNNFLDLDPVLGALAGDAGLICRIRRDLTLTPEESRSGKSTSMWAVLAARDEDLGPIAHDPRWEPASRDDASVWTDDYSDLVSHLNFLGRARGRKEHPAPVPSAGSTSDHQSPGPRDRAVD